MDPTYAVQVALVDRLKDLGTAAGSRVFDSVKKGVDYPYITVGPGQTVPIDETCWDASEVFVQVDVWSRAAGYPEVKGIAGALCTALHDQPLTIAGHICDRVEVKNTDYSREADGVTHRARINLLITTQPE